MLPEGQTSAELTPDEKTDDPIADSLSRSGLGFGQLDGSRVDQLLGSHAGVDFHQLT